MAEIAYPRGLDFEQARASIEANNGQVKEQIRYRKVTTSRKRGKFLIIMARQPLSR
ncbi:MAG: hypothetical protein LBG57_06705 [Treponema sp.]|jgi:hypothetical protein|nr:hypothetical protein [Treponema sp.]